MIAAMCLAALLAGQSADIGTGLRLGASYHEGNPFLTHSFVGSAVIKGSATTALAISGWRIRHRHPKLACGLFLAGAVAGSVGAWHNAHLKRF